LIRVAVAVCLLGLVPGLAACGGGSKHQSASKRPPPAASQTAPQSTTGAQTDGKGTSTQPATKTAPKSPEEQPGGAGDEQPARVPASFSGRAGRISPRTVHVPPYIAVRVELRSGDGRSYGLRFPGALLRAGGGRSTDSATLSGLRPGKSVSGTPVGGSSSVRIVADAEPGP
jgi:hypothetical protein